MKPLFIIIAYAAGITAIGYGLRTDPPMLTLAVSSIGLLVGYIVGRLDK